MIKIREITYTQETKETVLRDIAQVKQVWLQSYKTTYLMLPKSYLDGLTEDNFGGDLKRPPTQEKIGNGHYLFVAENETGEMVGYAYCGRNPLEIDGELYQLFLRKEYQGRNIGSELFNRSKSRLLEQGCQTMILRCVEKTPACGFYERLGGVASERRLETKQGVEITDVLYSFELRNS
jgi:GNAT superfamily N-acetyltransferase